MFLHLITHPRFLASVLMMTSAAPPPAFGQGPSVAPITPVANVASHVWFAGSALAIDWGGNNWIGQKLSQDWTFHLFQAGSPWVFPVVYRNSYGDEGAVRTHHKKVVESFERSWDLFALKTPTLGKNAEGGEADLFHLGVISGLGKMEGTVLADNANHLMPDRFIQSNGSRAKFVNTTTPRKTRRTKWGQKLFQIIKCNGCHLSDRNGEFEPRRGHWDKHDLKEDHRAGSLEWKAITRNLLRWKQVGSLQWRLRNAGLHGRKHQEFNLQDIILKHGGKAEPTWKAFSRLPREEQALIIEYLQSVLPVHFRETVFNGADPIPALFSMRTSHY